MTNMFSFSILGKTEFTEVPQVGLMSDILLDDRHLSKSALRALDVLEFFAARQQPARATEVAHSLGMSTSSTDQLLKTLVSRAYLIFDMNQKLYRLSPRLLGFAGVLEQNYFGGNNLHTLIQDLVERTGCPVGISTSFGRLMQLVDCAAPPGRSYGRQPGHAFPMFSSAAGNVLLANWPVATVRSMIAQSADQLGPLSAMPDVIIEHLNEVRANGHAFGGLSEDADQCSIAAALPTAGLGTELSISLRGPIEDLTARRWRLAAYMQEAIAKHLQSPKKNGH